VVRNNECGEYEVGGTGLSLDVNIFSVPLDKNVLKKEEENVVHYTPLSYEIWKLHKVSTKIVPLVVGALGVVLEANLKIIRIPDVPRFDASVGC